MPATGLQVKREVSELTTVFGQAMRCPETNSERPEQPVRFSLLAKRGRSWPAAPQFCGAGLAIIASRRSYVAKCLGSCRRYAHHRSNRRSCVDRDREARQPNRAPRMTGSPFFAGMPSQPSATLNASSEADRFRRYRAAMSAVVKNAPFRALSECLV